MSAKSVNSPNGKKPATAATNLIGRFLDVKGTVAIIYSLSPAGGGAGAMEALACHPLGTCSRIDARPITQSIRYDQGQNAAFAEISDARSMKVVSRRRNLRLTVFQGQKTGISYHWKGHCQKRNAASSV